MSPSRSGVPFFGRPTTQRRVVYVALEGQSGFYARIAAWLTRHPEAALDLALYAGGVMRGRMLSAAGRFSVT